MLLLMLCTYAVQASSMHVAIASFYYLYYKNVTNTKFVCLKKSYND